MSEHHDKQLKELMATTPCKRGCACVRSDLQEMGKVEIAAQGKVLFCREEHVRDGQYWLRFGDAGVCTCPIRRYIARHLGK